MKSVLVIDDSETIRLYLRYILEDNDYYVYEAANGKEGYELFERTAPDCLIIDIFMPEMDGIEVIKKIMLEYPDSKIIAISGGSQIQELPYFEICKRFGVNNCLSKPINKDVLLLSLKNLV